VLYIRGIYHPDLFARHKLFNTAVYKSRYEQKRTETETASEGGWAGGGCSSEGRG
jgi:hypothetical protein